MGRRLGQHFLTDPAILERIVAALNPQSHDSAIEIGPGRGTLTRRLAPRVAQVIAIEKDRELAKQLQGAGSGERAQLLPDNVTVEVGDALKLDWHELVTSSGGTTPHSRLPDFKIVGNIPYYITSPLIEKALTPPPPVTIVYLIQREVADRVAAKPGTSVYGGLSVGVQVAARVERLFGVTAGAFRPPPKVDSAVVRLTPLQDPLIGYADRAAFRRFITAVFGYRRKQLSRVIRSVAGLEKEAADDTLSGIGADPTARPEVLSPHAFVQLFEALAR